MAAGGTGGGRGRGSVGPTSCLEEKAGDSLSTTADIPMPVI